MRGQGGLVFHRSPLVPGAAASRRESGPGSAPGPGEATQTHRSSCRASRAGGRWKNQIRFLQDPAAGRGPRHRCLPCRNRMPRGRTAANGCTCRPVRSKDPSEAGNVKAQLALMGSKASVQRAQTSNRGTVHRVRVGPFSSQSSLERKRAEMAAAGITIPASSGCRQSPDPANVGLDGQPCIDRGVLLLQLRASRCAGTPGLEPRSHAFAEPFRCSAIQGE